MTEPRLCLFSERPDLTGAAAELNDMVWPAFVDATDACRLYWDAAMTELADFQFMLLSGDEEILATGHTLPVWWDRTVSGLPVGWDDGLTQGVLRARAGAPVNTLMGLAITIAPHNRGRKLSPVMIGAMKQMAADRGLNWWIGPVRPTLKPDHPQVPMSQYITWQTDDGRIYDPWLRAHVRDGAQIAAVAERSMVAEAPIADWEAWTGMCFDRSGAFEVPRALAPVQIDLDGGVGRYAEPNVWMTQQTR